MTGRVIPVGGIVVAVVTGTVLVFAGTSPLLALPAILVWIASFWLAAPPPPPATAPVTEGVQLTTPGRAASGR